MECPDKLEPKVGNHTGSNPQYLTSVLKNVPVELMWHLREYHSKPSHFEIKWRARQPVEGKKYGWGGDLKWEDARSGDMYVRDRSLEQKYQHLLEKHRVLRSEYDDLNDVHRSLSKEYNDLIQDKCDGEYWKKKHGDLAEQTHNYREEWRTKHDDLLADHMDGEEWKARHDDLLHQVQDVERGKAQEWTDDMSEQADKDYDAVTKGVISFINLLRR